MNSRERVFAALEGRIPDRVPTMEILIDPKVIDAICPVPPSQYLRAGLANLWQIPN